MVVHPGFRTADGMQILMLELTQTEAHPDLLTLPDLAISAREIHMEGDTLVVSVHNIGSADTSATEIVVKDDHGQILVSKWAPPIVALLDLIPMNEARMGSILEYQPDDDRLCRRDIKVTVCGTDYIRRVDIMKNNGLFHRVCPKSDRVEFTVTDELDQAPTSRDWYYVRVFQADNNAAWSSPIWIGPAGVDSPSVSLGE